VLAGLLGVSIGTHSSSAGTPPYQVPAPMFCNVCGTGPAPAPPDVFNQRIDPQKPVQPTLWPELESAPIAQPAPPTEEPPAPEPEPPTDTNGAFQGSGRTPPPPPFVPRRLGPDQMLSNDQKAGAFRGAATNCFYCGNRLNTGRGSDLAIIGHVYPNDLAMRFITLQSVWIAYLTDVRGLRVICNSCNGIQGKKLAPKDMKMGRWATPTRQAEAQAIYDLIASLYGFGP
jgi:hypothetical protein